MFHRKRGLVRMDKTTQQILAILPLALIAITVTRDIISSLIILSIIYIGYNYYLKYKEVKHDTKN
jgi:hypothetical protein